MVTSASQVVRAVTSGDLGILHISRVRRLAPNPVDDAGLLSFATFSWLTPVMVSSYRSTLTGASLPPMSPYDSSDINAKRYHDLLGSPGEKSSPGEGSHEPCGVCPCPLCGTGHLGVLVALLRTAPEKGWPACTSWCSLWGGEAWPELVWTEGWLEALGPLVGLWERCFRVEVAGKTLCTLLVDTLMD